MNTLTLFSFIPHKNVTNGINGINVVSNHNTYFVYDNASDKRNKLGFQIGSPKDIGFCAKSNWRDDSCIQFYECTSADYIKNDLSPCYRYKESASSHKTA